MAEPFSIGAATAGFIPLIIQLVDGCIKGYQWYTAAVDMPKEYTNLMTLFRWEQRRFLEFCQEAGLLYRDTGRSMPIEIDRDLLIATLREVDRLLSEFAKKDEAYYKMTIPTNLAIQSGEPYLVNLIDILNADDKHLPGDQNHKQVVVDAAASYSEANTSFSDEQASGSTKQSHRRRLYASIKHAKEDFRSVLCQPRRLRWAMVDKGKFEELMAKLTALNSHLMDIPDRSWKNSMKSSIDCIQRRVIEGGLNVSRQPPIKPIFYLPFPRDKDFVGREDVLSELLDGNGGHAGYQFRAALVGIGGVGKSQIAIEYGYRLFTQSPQHIFWVNGDSEELFKQSYRQIAVRANIITHDEVANLDLVHRWLSDETNGRFTLILDNVDEDKTFTTVREPDKKALREYLPIAAHGAIVLTSRNSIAARNLIENDSILTVENMNMANSLELLQTKISINNQKEAGELVKALDCLPLAISHAGSLIRARKATLTVKKYLEMFKDEKTCLKLLSEKALKDSRRGARSSHTVLATWQISFDAIREEDQQAANLLSLMSMMDNSSIPRYLLTDQRTSDFDLDLDARLELLISYSLVSLKSDNTYKMHRLVQRSAIQWLEQQQKLRQQQALAVTRVSNAFPAPWTGDRLRCRDMRAHVDKIVKYDVELEARIYLIQNFAHYLRWLGQYTYAANSLEKAQDIGLAKLTDAHRLMTRGLTLQGYLLLEQKKLTEAKSALCKALEQYQRLDVEHGQDVDSLMDSLMARSLFCELLTRIDRPGEAEELVRPILASGEKLYGSSDVRVLNIRLLVGRIKTCRGLYDDVIADLRKALVITEESHGSYNEISGELKLGLAVALCKQGEDAGCLKAIDLSRNVLIMWRETFGPDSQPSIYASSVLAGALFQRGEYAETIRVQVDTLVLAKKILEPGNQAIIRAGADLAATLQKLTGKAEHEIPKQDILKAHRLLNDTEHEAGHNMV